MKSLVQVAWLPLFCAGALTARAQLGTVNFNNNFTPPGSSKKAFLTDLLGQPLPKGSWQVDVLDSNGALIKSGALAANGLFFLGVIEIPGSQPGGTGMVLLRGWDNTTGSSFASATLRGQTIIQLYNLGGGTIPAPLLGLASDFIGLSFGPLTPPYSGPPIIYDFDASRSHFQIRAALSEGPYAWRLMVSEDLVNWTPVGEPSPGGYGQSWLIPNPSTPTFLKVVRDPPGP